MSNETENKDSPKISVEVRSPPETEVAEPVQETELTTEETKVAEPTIRTPTRPDNTLLQFKAISNFVKELAGMYETKHKPLRLYAHLLSRTQLGHETAIAKNIEIFRKFCVANRSAIMSKDIALLQQEHLVYSKKVFIDMSVVFGLCDEESTAVIWEHLLCISALVDPAGRAKEILQRSLAQKTAQEGKGGGEAEFLTNLITKVEDGVQGGQNPMDAVGSIMQSGVFTELIGEMQGGLQSGNLDLSKILGAVQGMVAGMNDQVGDDPEAQQMMSMLSGMTSMVGARAGGGNMQAPDMSAMMRMMSGMTQSAPPTRATLEEHRSPGSE